jgi:hypothetical protein
MVVQLSSGAHPETASRAQGDNYVPWSVIERSLGSADAALNAKRAFMGRKEQVGKVRSSAKTVQRQQKIAVLALCSLGTISYLILEIIRTPILSYAAPCILLPLACLGAFIAFLVEPRKTAPARLEKALLGKEFKNRAVVVGQLIVAVLLRTLSSGLQAGPDMKYGSIVSGFAGGVRIISVALFFSIAADVILRALMWTRRRRNSRKDPDLILFHHLAVLAKLLNKARPSDEFSTKVKLCEFIEWAARAVDIMPYELTGPRQPDSEVMRQRYAAVAAGLRALKLKVTLPQTTYENLTREACRLCMISATGLYGLLPEDVPMGPKSQSRRAQIARIAQRITAATLPFAVYVLFKEFRSLLAPFPSLQHNLPALGLASLFWFLVYIMRLLDPDAPSLLTDLDNVPFH